MYVGIDPGKKGAYAVVDASGKVIALQDLPVDDKDFVRDIVANDRFNFYVAIEDVYGYPGMSVVAVTTFMKLAGKAELLAQSLAGSNEVKFVRPQTWKKHYGLDKDKNKSVELAKKLFPEIEDKLLKTKDGRAEALLIANWLKETM